MEALRRPALPEDAVRSRLFAAAAGPGGEALLRRCVELALVRLAPLLAACVWQRQPFRLRYVPGRGEPGAGREARREERPERRDWEGHPAAGNREPLVQQQFVPDRRSGYTLPAPAHPQYGACELGMKLAHGFEMLCSKSSKVAPDAKRNVLSGPLWERFLRSLKEKDYFKGEMEGSAKYLELLHMAEDHFQQSVAVPESCDEVSPGDEILTLLQTTPIDVKELEREAACLPAEDDDSWLDITPGALDQMLRETRNESLPSPNEEEQKYDLETVAESMKAFVSKVSTQEGAEMPWSSDESHVTFDVDSFTKALDRILGADLEELDCDDVDEEEEFGFSAEDDEELDAGNGRQEQKVSPEELVGSLKAYMKEMDRELAQSNVGKSFSSHKRGASSVGAAPCESAGPDCGAEAAELAALAVDMNLVAKLLESHSAQAGLAGPSWNI
ncbi:protein ecdysoneless homolog [Melozone crissalis]|uniref:protein ecdysoneless homolog n=1 Tax=Melozone crissalis TaxID=40204 RepID=UPI0023DA0E1C|nr:protein ecdysoneless homolog [Melozone crissalis]